MCFCLQYSALCITCYASSMLTLIGAALLAIRVKHFLLNCILYVLVNRTLVNNNECRDTSFLTSGSNTTLDVQHSEEMPNILYSKDGSATVNNSEDICDSSWLECTRTNFTGLLSFKIREASPLHTKLLKYVAVYKSNVLNKNSLFHSRHGWPNL